MAIVFKDFGTAYLAAPLAVGGLTITVDSPSSLPVLQAGDYFYLVLQKYSDRSYVEIVKVTATAGSTYTIQRGQAGTVARAFALGDYAELRLTVGGLSEFIAQGIGTKMDKSGGGDFSGIYRFLNPNTSRLDIVRTSDDATASVALDFSASDGHRAIFGGPSGANVVTSSLLLRPNGYGNGVGQVKIDKDGVVDAVALVMRGSTQRTEGGAAVRYDELAKFVPKTRTINGNSLSTDFSLAASDVGALPLSGGVLGGRLAIRDILLVNGIGGNAIVERHAVGAFAFMDWVERGAGNWHFSQSNGSGVEVKRLMTLAPSGNLSTTGYQIATTTQWATASDGNSNIAIEAPAGDSPCLTFKSPNIPATVKGLTFNGSEVLFGQRAAGDFRVSSTHGLLFTPYADAAGVSWAAGVNPNDGVFAIKKFSSGTWQWDAFLINTANQLILNGATTVNGVLYGTSAIVSRSSTKQTTIGLEAPEGGSPYISFKTPGLSSSVVGLIFTGNEIVGEQRFAASEMRVGVNAGLKFSERADLAGVSWGIGMDSTTGTLGIHKYVSGVWSAQPFAIDASDTVSVTRLTALNKVYAGGGNGALNENGNVSGTVYGAAGTVTGWCTASFSPISDATMKRNIKTATKSALDDVAKLVFVSYDWDPTNPLTLGKKSAHIGVTAQQVEEIDGSYARDVETHAADGSVGASVKSLDLVNLLSLALKAIQEQSAQVSSLRSQVARLLG